MKLVLTGTGTSQGIPVLGCTCDVCNSKDSRDFRLRTAALLMSDNANIALDVGPDFRAQMLAAGTSRLDAVFVTHEHNDHVIGLDDVRPYNFKQKSSIPLFALPRVLTEIQTRFAYIFAEKPYPGAPTIDLHPLEPFAPVEISGIRILPFLVHHGSLDVLGFRIGDVSYITDANALSSETYKALKGSRVLVLNALHHRSHHSHFNLEQAIETSERIGPRITYLTHMSHSMGLHAAVERTLPANIRLAYDGLEIEV
ncbi:MAG: MBL fold metallo-hydrolase [Saprospiraceae bacterium]|nr:MBL fold metallo-hydrolase [Saprospiraceae bacterium]